MDELSERGVPNWLSTHPEPASRVTEAGPIAAKLASPTAADRNRDVFLQHINGIVVGDNPEDGVVRGNRFLHPAMRFALEFPEGWDVQNSPSQVAAKDADQPHYMLFQLVDRPQGRDAREIAARAMTTAGFRQLEGQATQLNNVDAYVGLYQGQISGIGRVVMRAAHIVHGRQVFVLAGFAPEAEFGKIDRQVTESIRTFRAMSEREAAAIRPNRLDFYTVRAGDTWQSIAARGGNLVRATELAIMNHRAVNEQPEPGQRIKIVVEG
jgi:predicted Zn-dependent protease